ncbi:MAG: glycosyltransferase [Candidatus Pacearchaeota archaeon]|nr:glycosyltransferase [Candidatus Pacearchaeota archaeon]
MKMEPEKVSIVIPAYNEEKRIRSTLESYIDFFKDIVKKKEIKNFEIIVVVNNSSDKTFDIVKEFNSKHLKAFNFNRGGKGFAVTEGFKEALKRDSNLIGFVDADMATSPKDFYDLIKKIGECDGIIPNRWHKESVIKPERTLTRKIFSKGFNFGVNTLFWFNHPDTQCGAKLFRRELIETIIPYLGSSQWSFDVDLLFYAKKHKAKIKSIPTVWIDKEGSHINKLKTPITMAMSVMRLRLFYSPFRFVVVLYDKLPERVKIHKRM